MAIGLCSEPFNFNSGSVCSDIVLGPSKQSSGYAALIYMYVDGRKGKSIKIQIFIITAGFYFV